MLAEGIEVRTILEFPNYAITRDGKVWSKPRKDNIGRDVGGVWLTFYPSTNGKYSIIRFWIRNKKYARRIHQLVLETYVGPCPKGMECRHLNGNPADNRLDNLCWGTHQENMKDMVRHGTHITHAGEKNGQAKLTEQDVRMIVYMYRTGLLTKKEIAGQYKITRQCITLILNRKNWKHLWAA